VGSPPRGRELKTTQVEDQREYLVRQVEIPKPDGRMGILSVPPPPFGGGTAPPEGEAESLETVSLSDYSFIKQISE